MEDPESPLLPVAGNVAKQLADVERIKAKVEAMGELRKMDSERFAHLNEEIGELRNLILEKEREIKDIGVKAETATDMMKELRPEKILGEIKKGLSGIEKITAMVDVAEDRYRKLAEEIKMVREKLAVVKGVDALMKLNRETGENLRTMEKIRGVVEKESSKVEDTYVQFQKQVQNLQKLSEDADSAQDAVKELEKGLSALKTKTGTIAWKGDIEQLGKDVNRLQTEVGRIAPAVLGMNMVVGELKARTTILEGMKEEAVKSSQEAMRSTMGSIATLGMQVGSMEARLENLAKASREAGRGADATFHDAFEELYQEMERLFTEEDYKGAARIYRALSMLYARRRTKEEDAAVQRMGRQLNSYFKRLKNYH